MQLLFYIIIVAVVVVKLFFWTVYLCLRKRRLRRQMMENRAIDICYEEVPAVPQPAYVFSGLSPEDLRQAVLIESLPVYQAEDPFKIDRPPPSYGDNFNAQEIGECSSNSRNFEEFVSNIETSDTSRLMENIEDEEEDFICLQQMV